MQDVWKLMVEKFGLVPSLLLFVVGWMYRQQIKEWKFSAARYEREIDRISDEKTQLWDRLLAVTGNKKSSSKDKNPKPRNGG